MTERPLLTVEMEVNLAELQRVQRVHRALIARMSPKQGLGKILWAVGDELTRYAGTITHRWSGTLATSHRMSRVGDDFIIFPLGIPNVFSRVPVSKYAHREEERGGSHAFYARTVNERGDAAIEAAFRGYGPLDNLP